MSAEKREKYNRVFALADRDRDGAVGIADVLAFFSKLPEDVTRSIWSQVNPQGAPHLSVRHTQRSASASPRPHFFMVNGYFYKSVLIFYFNLFPPYGKLRAL